MERKGRKKLNEIFFRSNDEIANLEGKDAMTIGATPNTFQNEQREGTGKYGKKKNHIAELF